MARNHRQPTTTDGTLLHKLTRLLEHSWFFAGTLILLIVQALWLTLTAAYPLPFDEYYHFGIIKVYAEQWSPFITQQPPEASLLGDITRTPSYLFHYLMSFPYRVLDSIFPTDTGVIISLRLLNIGLFTLGLVLFRKLLLSMRVPRKITHLALFIIVCLPITPFLAAHINYDNLLFTLTPIVLWLAYRQTTRQRPSTTMLVLLVTTGTLTSLVKETFLPIYLICLLYVAVTLIYRYKQRLAGLLWQDFYRRTLVVRFGLVLMLVFSIGMFVERYGVNQVRYGGYNAECSVVQPLSVCEQYAPWYRNQQNKLNKPVTPLYGNFFSYTQHWVSKVQRGYFAIFSHTPTAVVSDKEPFGPIVARPLLPLPVTIASIAVVLGFSAVLLQIKTLWRRPAYRFSIVVILFYGVVVLLFNYRQYLDLGAAQAIQARYLMPLLPLTVALMIQAVSWTMPSRTRLKGITLASAMLIFVYGSGITGWLIRSDSLWYWQNQTVIQVNETVGDALKNIVWH
ncbi:hypothetical protein KA047_02985 [Candidatus Saccharibacteria bacterium]|nr:hypothetical protein [Candidatus Saccharibacteria bacterium]